MDQLRQQQLMQ
jgi:hypothetical protein